MLLYKEFLDEMNRLSDRFPGVNNKEVIKRIYGYVETLPHEALKTIVNDFLDTFRQAPLPLDFQKAATVWRRQYFLKNGSYFMDESNATQHADPGPECIKCTDLGLLRAKGEDKPILFRCLCEYGLKNPAKVPRYEGVLRQAYIAEPLPVEWFKTEDIWEKEKSFMKFVHQSEAKWVAEGYVYEDSSDRWGMK